MRTGGVRPRGKVARSTSLHSAPASTTTWSEPDVPQRFAPVATYYSAAYTDGVTTYLDDTD